MLKEINGSSSCEHIVEGKRKTDIKWTVLKLETFN